MGPRSENRGYRRRTRAGGSRRRPASMGPRSENRGYSVDEVARQLGVNASMGPRSENRGYPACPRRACTPSCSRFNGSTVREPWLLQHFAPLWPGWKASMGPRSENRGYWGLPPWGRPPWGRFNGSTVREPWLFSRSVDEGKERVASMGPRSENRGYAVSLLARGTARPLQWVHGPRTVVMPRPGSGPVKV